MTQNPSTLKLPNWLGFTKGALRPGKPGQGHAATCSFGRHSPDTGYEKDMHIYLPYIPSAILLRFIGRRILPQSAFRLFIIEKCISSKNRQFRGLTFSQTPI